MKQNKLIKILTALVIATSGVATVSVANHQPVQAAYYRGAKVTTPKSIRGTWYNYNKVTKKIEKWKITSHTITLPKVDSHGPHGTFTLYKQNNKIYKKVSGNAKYLKKANKYASKHKWMVAWNFKSQGHKYLGIDPFWLDSGDNDYGGGLRATTIHKNGKSIKQLILKNPNSTRYFYKSASIAKHMAK